MTIAVTIAADAPTPAADRAARSRAARSARTRPAASSIQPAGPRTSTSAPLLTEPDQRRPAPRERALEVGHAGIEIARRPAELHRHPDPAAGAPGIDTFGGERADDGDEDAAGDGSPDAGVPDRRSEPAGPGASLTRIERIDDRIDVDAERHAGHASLPRRRAACRSRSRTLRRPRESAGRRGRPRRVHDARAARTRRRSDGRHASRHASAESMAPPTAKAPPTARRHDQRARRRDAPERRPDAHAISSAIPASERDLGSEQADGANRRAGRGRESRRRRAHRQADASFGRRRISHESTKRTKTTDRKGLFVSSCASWPRIASR